MAVGAPQQEVKYPKLPTNHWESLWIGQENRPAPQLIVGAERKEIAPKAKNGGDVTLVAIIVNCVLGM